jgi:spore coat protein U-like protein
MIWPLFAMVWLVPLTVEDAAASYTISLDAAAQHRVTIEAVYPAPDSSSLELQYDLYSVYHNSIKNH